MTTATPKHRLRWYQYSLRSLFVLTVLVAIAGSWLAWKKQQVERQRAAVKAIEEMGGAVYFDYQFDASGRLIRNAEPPGPAWLRAWLGDDFFAHVDQVMVVHTREFGDADLDRIRALAQITYLDLSATSVTDSGLENLKGMERIRFLILSGTRVSDAGLEQIKRLKELQGLILEATQVTDAGLEHLKDLPKLRHVDLNATNVTNDGFKKLRRDLPNCEITGEP